MSEVEVVGKDPFLRQAVGRMDLGSTSSPQSLPLGELQEGKVMGEEKEPLLKQEMLAPVSYTHLTLPTKA